MSAEVGERALSPRHCQAQAFFSARAVGGILGAFIEGHGNVSAEGDLHVHGMLWREEVTGAVEVRAEADTFVRDFAESAEGKDLKAAGVGEHGARPGDKAMQAAHAADRLVAGAQIEMVGVAKDDFGAEGFERVLGNCLYGASGADGHEDGGFDGPMGQVKLGAAAAFGSGVQLIEGEGH